MAGSILTEIKQTFETNQRLHDGLRYTIPSGDTYPYQWFWDSCFNAIILSYFDVGRAKEELKLLTRAQFKNGMIPHIIYWHRVKGDSFPDIHWGKHLTSSITQPPLLAAAVWRIYEADGDVDFVKQMLPHIHGFHRYLFKYRDPHELNLVAVINPDESGEDNSPRYDQVIGLTTNERRRGETFRARLKLVDEWRESRFAIKKQVDLKHWVYDVPYNSILAESLRLTSLLAEVTDEQLISNYSKAKAYQVRLAMTTHMRRQHLYQPVYGADLKHVAVRTWAIFMPLYAGVVSQAEAHFLVDKYLLNPREFKAPYTIPTVSLAEVSFMDGSEGPNWRGPIWLASNWLVLQGLLRYGFYEEATNIYRQSLQLLSQSGFREHFDPGTGEGHGARGFTWSGLVLDMEELLKNKRPAR